MYNYTYDILHDVDDNLLLVLPLLFVLLLKLQQLLQLVAAHHQPEQFTVKEHCFFTARRILQPWSLVDLVMIG